MDPSSLIIQLIAGVAGGFITDSLFPDLDLGTMANTVIGMLGGILGSWAFSRASFRHENVTDIRTIFSTVIGGTFGGALLTAIAGLIANLAVHI